MSTFIELTIENNVGTISLNNPSKGNAINLDMAKELFEATHILKNSSEVKVVLIKAAGKNFSFGGDLFSFQSEGENASAHLSEVTSYLHQAIGLLTRMQRPVVGAVQGVAAGAGFSLAISCDLVIASASAKFTPAYTKVGLTPDASCTYLLPRLIGMRKAQELLLLNPVLDAYGAEKIGLITKVVSDEDLLTESERLIDELLKGSASALGKTKNLLAHSFYDGIERHLVMESESISRQVRDPDGIEGVSAFIEKRIPNFQ